MPKLSPEAIDQRKMQRAQDYVAAYEAYEKAVKQFGTLSKEATDAYRHWRYCDRQFQKVRWQ